MWDTEHDYSFGGAVDDLRAAVAFVRSKGADDLTPGGNSYRIDPERIAAFGLSGGGGNVSFGACAEDEHIKAAIAVAPGNVDSMRDLEAIQENEMVRSIKELTAGRIDMAQLAASATDTEIDRVSIFKQAENLAPPKASAYRC